MAVVLNPDTGELAFVDDPAGLVSQGWRIPSPEEAEQRAKEIDASTFGQQALAQGERVVRGATIGNVRGLAGTEEEQQTRADVSQREHPALSFAADTVPMVAAGALAATGVGAVAEGLGAAAGGALASGAALAGESAAGGLVGAGQAAYERGQYLGENPGLDAENALIFGGLNFGLGAASKALFGAAKGTASRFAAEGEEAAVEGAGKATLKDVTRQAEADALQRAPAEAAEQAVPETLGELLASPEALPLEPPAVPSGGVTAEREAADDGMDRALSNASRSEAQDIVQEAVGAKVPTPEVDSFARQRALYQNRDAILDVSTREMQSDLTDLMRELPSIAGGGKIADVSRNVGDNLSAQRAVTDGIAENAANLAGTLRGEAKAYAAASGKTGLQYEVPGSKGFVQALAQHAQALADADSGKAMFEAANSFKQILDDHKLSFETGSQNALNPKAFQDLIPRVSQLASQVRTALEDSSVWGKAGDMQGAYNAVIHDQLVPSMKVFEESLLKRTSKSYENLWQMEGWESKIQSLLQGGDAGKVRHVNGVLDALDQLASVRTEYGDAATGTRMSDQVAKIRRTMGLAEEVQDATGRMQAVGQVAGHLPLVGGLAKEWVTGDLANAFRRLSGAVDRGIDRGVDDWIASSRLRGDSGSLLGKVGGFAARAVTGSGEDSAVAQTARRLGVSHGLARFMGQDQNPQAAFERARAALQSDEQFFQSLGQDYKSLQQQAPETYLMLAGRAAGDRAFLLQRMPPNVSVSMMRPNGYSPSRDSIEDWAIYWNAIRDPMHVVSNIRSARIQEIQTLQERRPRLYERMQQRVIEKIGAAQGQGRPLDDALLLRLSLLFHLDGAGSPAFSRRATDLAASWNAQQQAAAPAPSRAAPKPPLSAGTVQQVAANGVTFGSGF